MASPTSVEAPKLSKVFIALKLLKIAAKCKMYLKKFMYCYGKVN